MIERWSWRGLAGTLAVAACGAGVSAGQVPVTRPPDLPVAKIDDRAPAADLDAPQSVTLTIAQPVAVRDLLLILVRGTAFSLVADDRVEGTFSGELKGLTMRQALEAVLFPRDLDYDVRGTLIRVFPRKPATRLFDVNYLAVRRSARATAGGPGAVGANARGTDVTTSAEPDLFDELTRGVERMLSPAGRAHVDRAAGLVQVTDFADRLDQIAVYVEAVQLRAARQVRLEARVFEVTLDSTAQSVNWNEVAARSGGALRPAAPGAAGIQVADFDAMMRAIASQGTVRLIAAPRLVAMNNQPALLRVGTEAVHFAPAGGDIDAVAPATALEGLTLLVTAQIAADGIVQLHVAPTYAERTGEARGPRHSAAPVLDVSETDTLVRVRDGETIIVSGFLRDRIRTTAGTGVAGFFGARSHTPVKSELVILFTPTVVAPGIPTTSGSK